MSGMFRCLKNFQEKSKIEFVKGGTMNQIEIKDKYKTKRINVDLKQILNEQQYKAATFMEGPMLIIAGAGTGKTHTLTCRIVNLVNHGVNPSEILMLTFTNKAAREMINRAKRMLGDASLQITACTYHSFCATMLRKYGYSIGIDPKFTIMDMTDAVDTIGLIKERMGFGRIKEFPNAKELNQMFSSMINKDISLEDAIYEVDDVYMVFYNKISQLCDEYESYKRSNNVFSYDDLLVLFMELIQKNQTIAKRMSDTFRYIMVDEYQDSNNIQFSILQGLRSFDNKNIVVVGDDQQSIYRFRWANFKNIMHFPDAFDDVQIVILDENYRSTQSILDLANILIKNAVEKYDKRLLSTREKGEKPSLVYVQDNYEESQVVLSMMDDIIQRGYSWNDICILIRKARESYILEQYFAKNKIPYVKYGGLRFMEKAWVKDIIAFLKVTVNREDEISWFRILKLYPNIGPAYAKKIIDGMKINGIEELNSKKHLSRKYGEWLPDVYNIYKKIASVPLLEQLEILKPYYSKISSNKILSSKISEENKKIKLAELEHLIGEYDILLSFANGYTETDKFLTDIMLDASGGEDEKDNVTITTIHSAKGLEFKYGFFLNCVRDTLQKSKEDEEEERRVFYVAVTRIMEQLIILFPQFQNMSNTISEKNPFVDELTGFLEEYEIS